MERAVAIFFLSAYRMRWPYKGFAANEAAACYDGYTNVGNKMSNMRQSRLYCYMSIDCIFLYLLWYCTS